MCFVCWISLDYGGSAFELICTSSRVNLTGSNSAIGDQRTPGIASFAQRLSLTALPVRNVILAKCALGAGSGEDYAYGARDDLQIHPETPILDIGHIQRGIIAVQNRLMALFPLDPELRDCLPPSKLTWPILPRLILHPLHGEHRRMQQDGKVHEEVPIADVVEVVLNVFVDQERAVGAELP